MYGASKCFGHMLILYGGGLRCVCSNKEDPVFWHFMIAFSLCRPLCIAANHNGTPPSVGQLSWQWGVQHPVATFLGDRWLGCQDGGIRPGVLSHRQRPRTANERPRVGEYECVWSQILRHRFVWIPSHASYLVLATYCRYPHCVTVNRAMIGS
jgi:hypothetical protein